MTNNTIKGFQERIHNITLPFTFGLKQHTKKEWHKYLHEISLHNIPYTLAMPIDYNKVWSEKDSEKTNNTQLQCHPKI
jgi:hypothetical protein